VTTGPPRAETLVAEKTTPANGTVEFAPVANGTYLVRVGCPNGDYLPTDDEDHDFTVRGNRTVYQRFKCCDTGGTPRRSSTTENGVRKASINTPQGKVTVYLPDDMSAGDTISGTVVAEPAGKTEEERAKNQDQLNGYVVDVAKSKTSLKPEGGKRASMIISLGDFAATATTVARIVLRDKSGKEVGRNYVRVKPKQGDLATARPPTPNDYRLPTIGQSGHPSAITSGNPRGFDGNLTNTTLTIGGQQAQILAESPRQVIFENPVGNAGPAEIVLKEGNVEKKGQYNNISVKLSAPGTTIMRGQKLPVTFDFGGLQGIKEDVPVAIVVIGAVTIEGGSPGTYTIPHQQVNADGTYRFTLPLTGEQTGAFTVTATIVTKGRERVVVSGPGGLVFKDGGGTPTTEPSPQTGTMPTACATLRDEADRLKEEIKRKEAELAGLPAEKQKTAAELDKCKSELAKAKAAQKKAADELANQERRKKNIEKNIGPGKTFPDKDAAKKNFGDYEKDYDAAKKAKDDADQKVADAQKKCDDLKKKLEDLAAKEKTLPGEIEELKRKLEDVLKKLGEWQSEEEKKKEQPGGTQPGGTQPGGTQPGGTQPGPGNPTVNEPPDEKDIPDWLKAAWEALKHAVPGSEFAEFPGGKEALGVVIGRINRQIVDELNKEIGGKPNNLKWYEELKDRLTKIYNGMK